jgi:hypothetical protein
MLSEKDLREKAREWWDKWAACDACLEVQMRAVDDGEEIAGLRCAGCNERIADLQNALDAAERRGAEGEWVRVDDMEWEPDGWYLIRWRGDADSKGAYATTLGCNQDCYEGFNEAMPLPALPLEVKDD